jgi:hypothetical protein
MNDHELDHLLNEWRAPEPSPALRRQAAAAFPVPERRGFLGMPLRWVLAGFMGTAAVALAAEMFTGGPGSLGTIGGGSVDTPSGPIYGRSIQMAEPPIAAIRWRFKPSGISFGETATGLRGSSWFADDRRAGPFYGLEYTADRLPDGRYLVKTDSLSLERLQRDLFVHSGPIIPIPEAKGPMIVEEGKSFDLDVYRSGNTRVFARVWLSSKPFPGITAHSSPMHFDSARLLRNGIELANWDGGDASGYTMWFRLPGQGRYVLALDPDGNSDFVEAGSIEGSSLEFHDGADTYRVVSKKPIAGEGKRSLYVWRNVAFESELKPGSQEILFGSSGKTCVFRSTCDQQR